MVTDKPRKTPLQHSTQALAERNAAMKARLDGVATAPWSASLPSLEGLMDPIIEGYRVYAVEMGSTTISWRCPQHPPTGRRILLPIMRTRPERWTETRQCEECGNDVYLPPVSESAKAFDMKWAIETPR